MASYNKSSRFTISIQSGTNRIISSSDDFWNGIKLGSYVQIGDEDLLFSISKINSFFYIKPFVLKEPRVLQIDEDIGVHLQLEDTLKISYKEYELDTITDIEDNGKLYEVDDVLIVSGGELSYELSNGTNYPTKFIVQETDDKGGISRLSVSELGKYIDPPSGLIELHGGKGNGAKLRLKYSVTDNRATVERVIKNIQIQDSKSFITIDYGLNKQIKTGKIAVNKNEILLSSNYFGEDQRNLSYKLYKDFTPNLEIPLLLKNSTSADLVFNKAVHILDKRIKELEDRIKKLGG